MTDTKLSPEMIERLRQTGIRIDWAGRLWHEGVEIMHPGLRRALLRWLDRREDGRPILRLDERRYAYVEVEDADLLVMSARWQDDQVWLMLNDGSEEELDYTSLEIGAEEALYCAVRERRLRARITTPAYQVLAQGIDTPDAAPNATSEATLDASGDTAEHVNEESFVLRARGTVFPIRRRQGH